MEVSLWFNGSPRNTVKLKKSQETTNGLSKEVWCGGWLGIQQRVNEEEEEEGLKRDGRLLDRELVADWKNGTGGRVSKREN